jgi:drug/metabolite transporter (DMT)-like permease
MGSNRRNAVIALIAAGLLWGGSVSLSKVALGWLDPAWLTVGRFGIAALVLGWVSRRRLRAALSWNVLGAGALGFGIGVVFQNVGIAHTSVSHASVLLGVTPALVGVAAVLAGHGNASRREWLSYVLSLAGIGLIAAGGGGGASVGGDIMVLISVIISAGLIAVQPGLLESRDPAAVTAVQFFGAAIAVLPLALGSGPLPAAPASAGPVIAFVALAVGGTVLPFWLFAYGQAKVRPQLAGAFVNLEPVIGAMIGWCLFADPVGVGAIVGALAVLGGIVLAATSRTLPVSDAAIRFWRGSVDLHEAMLGRPWQREGPLRWRWRGTGWELDGSYLPPEPRRSTRRRERAPQA